MYKTPLNDKHREAGAKMCDFAGWELPLSYGSQIEEHNAVRTEAGMFDVSHMNIVDIIGKNVVPFLKYLLANNVDKMRTPGGALYSCILNHNGGVIDDLVVYRIAARKYRFVGNAATHDKDMLWLIEHAAKFDVKIDERTDLAMIAVQGPKAREKTAEMLICEQNAAIANMNSFQGAQCGDWWIARTGYTGEDGYEIMLPAFEAALFWQQLVDCGVRPCGLIARDSLRLEAGFSLYGSEMDETVSPLEANLAWTVAFDPAEREFIGRQALEEQRLQGVKRATVGLILESKGIMRAQQKVIIPNIGEGIITSGGYSPTLDCSIALARVPVGFGENCMIEIRDKTLPAKIVTPPFVRNGKKVC
jgi:aminomethyltransferase